MEKIDTIDTKEGSGNLTGDMLNQTQTSDDKAGERMTTNIDFGFAGLNINKISSLSSILEEVSLKLKPNGYEIFNLNEDNKFDTVVIYTVNDGFAYYSAHIIKQTGPGALSVNQFIDKCNERNAVPYTLNAMFDEPTMQSVEEMINKREPGLKGAVEVAASVVHKFDNINDALNVASDAVMAIYATIILEDRNDICITELIKDTNTEFSINYEHVPEGVIATPQGSVVKANFKLSLSTVPKKNEIHGSKVYNKGNATTVLVETYGYVDFKLDNVQVNSLGQGAANKVKPFPEIIITYIGSKLPTLNYAILGMLVADIMKNDMIFYKHAIDMKSELGCLNLITNINDTKEPTAIPVDKIDDKAYVETLSKVLGDGKLVSIDIEDKGANENLNKLVDCVKLNNFKDFNESVSVLVGREIDEKAMPFINQAILPKITYHNNGLRDGRDMTLQAALNITKDIGVVYNLNDLYTGSENINEVVDAFGQIFNDGDVDGVYVRLTFNANYFDDLMKLTGIGSVVTYDTFNTPIAREHTFKGLAGAISNNTHYNATLQNNLGNRYTGLYGTRR